MSQAMDDLTHEHQALLHALELLDALCQRLRHPEQGRTVDPQDLLQLTGFFREFADRCHHGKEEDLLFPALAARALPRRPSATQPCCAGTSPPKTSSFCPGWSSTCSRRCWRRWARTSRPTKAASWVLAGMRSCTICWAACAGVT